MTPTLRDLAKMRRVRTWLVVVTAVLQGGQYVITPDRALSTPAYTALQPIGPTGWRTLGVLVLIGGLILAVGEGADSPIPRSAAFMWLALLETFLGTAQVLHGFAPSTLVLPIGVCLTETALTSRLRRRRARRGTA